MAKVKTIRTLPKTLFPCQNSISNDHYETSS